MSEMIHHVPIDQTITPAEKITVHQEQTIIEDVPGIERGQEVSTVSPEDTGSHVIHVIEYEDAAAASFAIRTEQQRRTADAARRNGINF